MLPLGSERFWERIGQMKRDELRQARLIAMGEITALMPPAKALLGVLHPGWRRPTPLAFDQIAHTGIVRRSGTMRFGKLAHAEYLAENSRTPQLLECLRSAAVSRRPAAAALHFASPSALKRFDTTRHSDVLRLVFHTAALRRNHAFA